MRVMVIAALMAAASPLLAAPLPTPVSRITPPQAVVSPANAAARPVPIDDLMAVRSGWGARWTPDGRAVIFTTNLTGRLNLWRIDLDQPFPVQLTRSNDAQFASLITADGQLIFRQDRDGNEHHQYYVMPATGGTARPFAPMPDHVAGGLWEVPGGRQLVAARRLRKGTAGELALIDRANGAVRTLVSEEDGARNWSVAGFAGPGRLIATRGNVGSSRAAIYAVDMASGAKKALTADTPDAYNLARAISPDGRWIALSSAEKGGVARVGLMPSAGGPVRWLAGNVWPRDVADFTPDGRSLIVSTEADSRVLYHRVDVATLAERPLALPDGLIEPFARPIFTRDGRMLIGIESGSRPADIYAYHLGSGRLTRLTRLALASVDPATLPRTMEVAYRSSDGTPISAVMHIPFNAKRDGSNPAVVIPHGGPTGQIRDSFDADATALASRGYFVIQPNFRGSTGYGLAFQNANKKDLGGGDLEDVVAATKFLVDTGYVDAKRIGITGGSYGGFMTLMALGKKPDVFAAGVQQYGIINWFSMWEQAGEGGLREYQRGLVGDPVADREAYIRQSPMTYLPNIKAPLLVLQGENDVRVPRGQAQEVVDLVKTKGVPVEAKFYAGEGHGFARIENRSDATRRLVEWFDKYLKK